MYIKKTHLTTCILCQKSILKYFLWMILENFILMVSTTLKNIVYIECFIRIRIGNKFLKDNFKRKHHIPFVEVYNIYI